MDRWIYDRYMLMKRNSALNYSVTVCHLLMTYCAQQELELDIITHYQHREKEKVKRKVTSYKY